MAKFYGVIGYATVKETGPGIFEEVIEERSYFGDIYDTARRLQTASDQVNDNVDITNRISIVADPFAYANFSTMRYVIFMGVKWKVKEVSVQHPRLVLTVGGVYNG